MYVCLCGRMYPDRRIARLCEAVVSRKRKDTHTHKNTSKIKGGWSDERDEYDYDIMRFVFQKKYNVQFLLALVCTIVYDFCKIQ